VTSAKIIKNGGIAVVASAGVVQFPSQYIVVVVVFVVDLVVFGFLVVVFFVVVFFVVFLVVFGLFVGFGLLVFLGDFSVTSGGRTESFSFTDETASSLLSDEKAWHVINTKYKRRFFIFFFFTLPYFSYCFQNALRRHERQINSSVYLH